MKKLKNEEWLENLKKELRNFIEESDWDEFTLVDSRIGALDIIDLAKSVGCLIVGQGLEIYRGLQCVSIFLKPNNDEKCNYLVFHLTKTAIIVERLF